MGSGKTGGADAGWTGRGTPSTGRRGTDRALDREPNETSSQVLRIREHFRVVTRLMAGALLVTDRYGVIQMVNPATSKLLGYEEDELVGRPVEVLFPRREEPDAPPNIGAVIGRALDGRPVERTELEAQTRTGERVPMAVQASPSRSSDGLVVGAVLVGTDLREVRRLLGDAARAEEDRARAAEVGQAYEELKELQERLIHAEKMASLDRLSAGVAHEINNPLGGILAYAHLLKEMLPESDRCHGYVDIIIREAARCRDIVRGLLDFARVSKGEPQTVDVNDILPDALALLSQQSLFHDIRTEIRPGADLPKVRVDRNHMQQAFFNIIYNAAQAMAATGGQLLIETSWDASRDRVCIRFSDTGPGIAEDALGKIFEPFFTTKDVGEGTGLGLAVVRGIVAQHGGTVRVQSESGQGATFTIFLPRAPGEARSL